MSTNTSASKDANAVGASTVTKIQNDDEPKKLGTRVFKKSSPNGKVCYPSFYNPIQCIIRSSSNGIHFIIIDNL